VTSSTQTVSPGYTSEVLGLRKCLGIFGMTSDAWGTSCSARGIFVSEMSAGCSPLNGGEFARLKASSAKSESEYHRSSSYLTKILCARRPFRNTGTIKVFFTSAPYLMLTKSPKRPPLARRPRPAAIATSTRDQISAGILRRMFFCTYLWSDWKVRNFRR